MLFLLQKDKEFSNFDIELSIIKELIDKTYYNNDYINVSINDFKEDICFPQKLNIEKAIPIGSIEFVSKYLKYIHGIDNMNPIEVPKSLRTDEFLKRDYQILKFNEIPKSGKYFIKDISKLKRFSYCGFMDDLFENENFMQQVNHNHLFLVSEFIDIISEYRLYFINGKLESMANYNGSPWELPDIPMIRKMNMIYSMQKDYPVSYTMDVAVTNKGTCILEIHPFMCVGLYNLLWGDNLLHAYSDGIEYYIKHNTCAS